MTEAELGTLGTLGILGGTFDPLHIGHLRLAIEAREALGLAAVRLIPAGSPLLRDTPQTAAHHRLAMVESAVADCAEIFSVDPAEIAQDGPSYTITTLERLRDSLGPDRSLVLLLGADAFGRLEAWWRWREIFDLAHVAVATRPGHPLKVGAGGTARPQAGSTLEAEFFARLGGTADLAASPAGRIVPFTITGLDISATLIRERLAAGRDVRHLLPPPVLDYIHHHHLYTH